MQPTIAITAVTAALPAGLSLTQVFVALVGLLVALIVARVLLSVAWRLATVGAVVAGVMLLLVQLGIA